MTRTLELCCHSQAGCACILVSVQQLSCVRSHCARDLTGKCRSFQAAHMPLRSGHVRNGTRNGDTPPPPADGHQMGWMAGGKLKQAKSSDNWTQTWLFANFLTVVVAVAQFNSVSQRCLGEATSKWMETTENRQVVRSTTEPSPPNVVLLPLHFVPTAVKSHCLLHTFHTTSSECVSLIASVVAACASQPDTHDSCGRSSDSPVGPLFCSGLSAVSGSVTSPLGHTESIGYAEARKDATPAGVVEHPHT